MSISMSFGILLIILALLLFIYEAILKSTKKGSLKVAREKDMCSQHDWFEYPLIIPSIDFPNGVTKNDLEDMKKKAKEGRVQMRKVCKKCGFVAQTNYMVRKPLLIDIWGKRMLFEEEQKKREDVAFLQNEYYNKHLNGLGYPKDDPAREFIWYGYDLHKRFVDELPELLKKRRLERLLEELKEDK